MNLQYSKLLLAVIVILAFSAVGVGIALRSTLFILTALIIGFAVMGYGISIKKKTR